MTLEEQLAQNDLLLGPLVEGYMDKMRKVRKDLLQESDITQLADAPLTDAKKLEWAAYRQALRDMPITNTSVTSYEDIIWPTKPE
tara:strand:- start:151 stop:405 length:255 start_codon:yes stop_codon:yes gene_type:complete